MMSIAYLVSALGAATSPAVLTPRTLTQPGHERIWSEYVPARCAGQAGRCMTVVLMHGGRGAVVRVKPAAAPAMDHLAIERFAKGTGMLAQAERHGFVLLVPAAVAGNWNDGRPGIADGFDDVGFVRAMLADVGKRANMSPDRTFVTGVSNGGLMSFRLACEASDMIRAIGPVVANISNALAAKCPAGRPVDIVQILGQQDPLMQYGGGQIGMARGGTTSAAESLRFWSARLASPQTSEKALNGEVTLRTVTGKDGRIAQYSLKSYGHGWPGAAERGGDGAGRLQGIRGVNPTGFDATDTIIAFFTTVKPR